MEAVAVALGGRAGTAGCVLPIAIPSCALTTAADICDVSITLNADQNDNGAWAGPGSSRPSAQNVRNAIESCVSADASQAASLNNGAITSASQTLAAAVSASSATWDTAAWGQQPAQAARSGVTHYGRVLTGPVASRQIKLRTSCDTVDGAGGGGFYGVTVPPTIVQ